MPHINQNRYSLFKEGWYYNNALQFINERIMKIPFVLISSSDCSSRSSFEPNEKNKTRSSIWFFKYQVKLFQLLEPDVMNIFPVLKPIRQDTSWIQYNEYFSSFENQFGGYPGFFLLSVFKPILQVSWIRRATHPIILSSGSVTFTSDSRVRTPQWRGSTLNWP